MPECPIKNGISSLVIEIGQNDGVFFGQSGRATRIMEEDSDADDDHGHEAGSYREFPGGAPGPNPRSQSYTGHCLLFWLRLPFELLQIRTEIGGMLIAAIPLFFQDLGNDCI